MDISLAGTIIATIEFPRLSPSTEPVAVADLKLYRSVYLILKASVLSLVSYATSEISPSPTQLASICTVLFGSKHSSTFVAASTVQQTILVLLQLTDLRDLTCYLWRRLVSLLLPYCLLPCSYCHQGRGLPCGSSNQNQKNLNRGILVGGEQPNNGLRAQVNI